MTLYKKKNTQELLLTSKKKCKPEDNEISVSYQKKKISKKFFTQ